MAEILIIGIAIAINFTILKYKYDRERYNDLTMDIGALLILSYLFGGTALGMAAAMVGGAIISIYLLFATTPNSKVTKSSRNDKPNLHINW